LPGQSAPVILPRRSDALYLVQRVRDEAHRFAITSHRARRNKIGMVSQLEAIPGVGPAKRKALLKAFDNSIDAIRGASAEQLSAVPGINPRLAALIKESI
ncbi:MAG TPA: helix-hairpin-helix domain-containing protein, partial [Phototrophicaceae bacterium]|nr:helix-hairpin-helix domain-containing protein [Phototrophicaceae bacterium]